MTETRQAITRAELWALRAIEARRLWVLDEPDPKRLYERCMEHAADARSAARPGAAAEGR